MEYKAELQLMRNQNIDITNFEETNTIIQKIKPDIVYHLAANISRNRDFSIYENMAAVNVQGTLNILKSLEGIDAHFIFTSSSEIYGNNESPFHENQIPKPVSPYSLSKINAEMLIQTYCNNHQKKFTDLRVFNFYGETMNVCSGKGTKLSTLASAVNSTMKTKAKIMLGAIPYRDNEVWEMIGDNSKIKNKIGFKPAISIEKGIEIVINKS